MQSRHLESLSSTAVRAWLGCTADAARVYHDDQSHRQRVKLPVSAPSGCSSRPRHQRDGYCQDDRADGLHHQGGGHQPEA